MGWGGDSRAEAENVRLWKTPGWGGTSGWGGTGPEELENTRLGKVAGQRGELGTPDWTRHQTGGGGQEDTGLTQPKFHRSGETWEHWDEGRTRAAGGQGRREENEH